jgi:heavy metal translocating P-type ATPase
VLEHVTISSGRRAIRELLDFLPRSVTIRRGGGVIQASIDGLRIGDLVLVNPGGLIPVDGVVSRGHSFVDQARITGESMPVEKRPGAMAYAGTINQSGALEIRTDRIGRDTSYGKIIEAIEEAERTRAPIQRLADRLAGFLVYFALSAAALTFLVTRDIRSTISVVIVAGACGIAAGTPLAILGAIGRATHLGAIIKGGVHLENLGRVTTIVLDKTGTITFGRTEVQDIVPTAGVSEREVIEFAASAELLSEHPLGKAIVTRAKADGRSIPEPTLFDYQPGRGISALVNEASILVGNRKLMAEHNIETLTTSAQVRDDVTAVLVARDGRFLGTIMVGDTVRPEARRAIEAFDRMGITTILMTGDAKPVSDATARQLGIRNTEAEMLPEAKLARVKELSAGGEIVAMLGDGVNDSPALAQATVGVAMGSGTDIARESADVVLLGNDLLKFVAVIEIARWTRRIIWQNFAGTIAIDAAGIVLAAAGVLSPPLAALIHVMSEVAFVLNSTRLLPSRYQSNPGPVGQSPSAAG